MIKHIVFWRLYGESKGFNKNASIDEFTQELQKLPNEITDIQSFNYGVNIIKSNDSADIVLECTFNSIDDLKKYQSHTVHLAFIEKIKHLRYERRVVDYEY